VPETTNLNIRIDRDLKNEAEQVFGELGMNLTTAITVFVRQAVRQKKIPFEIALYPEEVSRTVALSDAVAASHRIWQASMLHGTDHLSLDDINDEIAASREAKRAHKPKVDS